MSTLMQGGYPVRRKRELVLLFAMTAKFNCMDIQRTVGVLLDTILNGHLQLLCHTYTHMAVIGARLDYSTTSLAMYIIVC